MKNPNKNTDVARISATFENTSRNFFRYWLRFIRPLHKLSDREIDILASFLRIRYELSRNIPNDEKLLNSVLMSVETKRLVREEHNLTTSYFQVTMSSFKKKGVIKDGRIDSRLIPNVEVNSEGYKLILFFEIKNDV